MCQVTADYADLFCELFDSLPAGEFRSRGEAWLGDPRSLACARETEARALEGTLSAAWVGDTITRTSRGESDRILFGALQGLDRALAHANPLLAAVPPPAVAEYGLRYAESGRFDSGAVPGGLLPRFARPGRGGQLPDDLTDAFGALVRVQAREWQACDHRFLRAQARLTRLDRDAGLKVATAPMVRDPDELHWEMHERSQRRFYRIHPADREVTQRRIEHVVAGWDEHGVSIGIAPELCLSRRLLERWRTALRGREHAATSRLRLVIAGSGNIEETTPPANTAVLLDARTGEILTLQRKLHPFNLSPADIERWRLADRFQAPIDEDLNRGERLSVVEIGGARLAILVCEDLARLHAFASDLHAHGVSLIVVPVFARPTKDRRWERARAEVYSDVIGSSVVVANSLVMASILGEDGPVGTAIAVAPGQAAVGHASEADDVVTFTLLGGSPEVTHERTPERA